MEVWKGLIEGIREKQQAEIQGQDGRSNNEKSLRQLKDIQEEEEAENDKDEGHIHKGNRNMQRKSQLDDGEGEEESDSDNESERKQKKGEQKRQQMQKQESVLQSSVKRRMNQPQGKAVSTEKSENKGNISNRYRNDSGMEEQQLQQQKNKQINSKQSNDQVERLEKLSDSKQMKQDTLIRGSQLAVKKTTTFSNTPATQQAGNITNSVEFQPSASLLAKRPSLIKEGKYSQQLPTVSQSDSYADQSLTISKVLVGSSTNTPSASSKITLSKPEGASAKSRKLKMVEELEKSSQILQKKKQQLDINTSNTSNALKASSNIFSCNDPLLRTSNSFFKRNFLQKLNPQNQLSNATDEVTSVDTDSTAMSAATTPSIISRTSISSTKSEKTAAIIGNNHHHLARPKTNAILKRSTNNPPSSIVELQCLRISTNLMDKSQVIFDPKKSFAANMKIFEEITATLDLWIAESRKLEKAVDPQGITTETLEEEVLLWPQLCEIIDTYKRECENPDVQRVEKVIVEKSITDESLKKKLLQLKIIKKNILMDRLSKRSFSKEFSDSCLELFMKLTTATYAEFPALWNPAIEAIMELYEKYTVVFDTRVYHVMSRIHMILLKKMRQCSVSVKLVTDSENSSMFVDGILETFRVFAEQLADGWRRITELSSKKESNTKIHEKMFAKRLIYLKQVLKDLVFVKDSVRKLRKLRRNAQGSGVQQEKKFHDKKSVQENDQFHASSSLVKQLDEQLRSYQSWPADSATDIFDLSFRNQWEAFIKQFESSTSNLQRELSVYGEAMNQKEEEDHRKKKNISSEETQFEQEDAEEKEGNTQQIEETNQEEDDDDNSNGFFNPMFQTQVAWKIQ